MLLDFIQLGFSDNGSLYNTIYNKIKEAYFSGVLKKGERLPSVREAALQLGVSRTTIENAYDKLCIEGIVESLPQKGYYFTDYKVSQKTVNKITIDDEKQIKYDYSGRNVDKDLADIEVWKKTVRKTLLDSKELTSYGDSQGEYILREAISTYIYKSRGVVSLPENIIIGAGIGTLLNILCGLIGRDVKIGFENEGFKQAESVFADYGINNVILKSDNNGAIIESIIENDIDTLFLTPSALSKISVTSLSKRRNEYIKWMEEKENRLIIEDDYNGELRLSARTVPAFQNKAPDKTVYIGSFSKLLLPSVRLAYMVLPPKLNEKFQKRKSDFNQTCGKTEQRALAEYIINGSLEKHLRKLRRQYYLKSQLLKEELKINFPNFKTQIFETSLTVELQTNINVKSDQLCEELLKQGIKVISSSKNGAFKLSFAGIKENDIKTSIGEIKTILKEKW